MVEEVGSIKRNVVSLEKNQERMEDITCELESKSREVTSLQLKLSKKAETLNMLKQKSTNYVWLLRNKVEQIKRLKIEVDLSKKLLQGELAIVKHDLE